MKLDFSDPEIRYLIDYANLKQGIIKYQDNFLNEEQFHKFERKIYLGFPLVLPKGIKFLKAIKEIILEKKFFLNLEMSFRIMLELKKNISNMWILSIVLIKI